MNKTDISFDNSIEDSTSSVRITFEAEMNRSQGEQYKNEAFSESDSSSDSDGDDFVRRIASKLVEARLKRTRRTTSRDSAISSYEAPRNFIHQAVGIGRYSRDDAHMCTATSRKDPMQARSETVMVDSVCNTCEDTVTIDRQEYELLKQESEVDQGEVTCQSGIESTNSIVFLNLMVGDNGNSMEMDATANSKELTELRAQNEQLVNALKQVEFKSSLVKSERLLLSKQFQMIHNERDEMNTYIKAITGKYNGYCTR